MPAMDVTVFEIVPHPLHRGHWLLKANERIPYGLWYGELRQAISYNGRRGTARMRRFGSIRGTEPSRSGGY